MCVLKTAANCPDVGPLVGKAKLTAWQALCLHLLCEQARGTESFWEPYISMLPAELEMAEAHPLLWPEVKTLAVFHQIKRSFIGYFKNDNLETMANTGSLISMDEERKKEAIQLNIESNVQTRRSMDSVNVNFQLGGGVRECVAYLICLYLVIPAGLLLFK